MISDNISVGNLQNVDSIVGNTKKKKKKIECLDHLSRG
jgi:hypothetical protein